MKELLSVVTEYLDDPQAQYAFMIAGPWGSGKTYYWTHTLAPELQRRGPHVAYISLYGVAQPEDIDREVYLSLHPKLNNKVGKFGGVVGRIALKYAGIDTDDLGVKLSDWSSMQNVILCFDDLERCCLPVSDVLGYINQYVEHRSVKTIILCNEDEIRKSERVKYRRIKEKVIGRTVEYRLDHAAILESMISEFGTDRNFQTFLTQHRDMLLGLFRRSELENIRILKHALSNLRAIIKALDTTVPNDGELQRRFILVTLPLTFEHLSARGTEEQLRMIASEGLRIMFASMRTDEKEKKSYYNTYADRYLPEDFMSLIKSPTVFEYISTGYFDRPAFAKEVLELTGTKSEHEQAIDALLHYAYLDDAEFIRNWGVVREAVKDGRVTDLKTLHRLFEFTGYWAGQGLIAETRAQVRVMLMKAARDAVDGGKIEYQDHFTHELSLSPNKPDRSTLAFRRFLVLKNEEAKQRKDKERSQWFLKALLAAPDEAIRAFSGQLWEVPVLAFISTDELAGVVMRLPNPSKSLLRGAVEERYFRRGNLAIHKRELPAIRRLGTLLKAEARKDNARPRHVSTYLMKSLVDELQKVERVLAELPNRGRRKFPNNGPQKEQSS